MKDIDRRLQLRFRSNHAVITREDVLRLGGTEQLIRAKLHAGTWIRMHRNVYILAAAPRTPTQGHIAALAAAPDAVLSHTSAAWLLGLIKGPPALPEVAGTRQRHLEGVRVHEVKTLPPSVRVQGLPCTTATRTLVDLAAIADPAIVTTALDKALQAKLTAVPHLERALREGERGRPGAAVLRARLAERGLTGTPAPSVLESHMDRLLRRSALPTASPQHRVEDGRYRLDYAWPEVHLAVEVKGYAWHSAPEAAQADAQRERLLLRRHWKLLSFTWTEVTRRPEQVRAEIEAAYRACAAGGAGATAKGAGGPASPAAGQ